jgi:hypothetical protein
LSEDVGPRIGYWSRGNLGRFAEAARPWIFERELLRRVPEARVQAYAPLGPRHGGARSGGPPIAELGLWTPGRLIELADALDCVVVGGEDSIQASDVLLCTDYGSDADEAARTRPTAFFLEGLGEELERRCPVSWDAVSLPAKLDRGAARRLREAVEQRSYVSVRNAESRDRLVAAGVRVEIAVVPDPLLLLPRLLPASVLSRRLRFVRHMEWYPKEGKTVVLQGRRALVPSAEIIADAIAQAAAAPGASVVLLPLDPGDGEFLDAIEKVVPGPVFRVPPEAALEDRVAVLAHAEAFAGSSEAGAVAAAAFGTPGLLIGPSRARMRGSSDHGLSRCGAGPELAPAVERLLSTSRGSAGAPPAAEERLQVHFDALARVAQDGFARRLREEGDPVPRLLSRLRESERTLGAWRVAWTSRSRQLVESRLQMADALEKTIAGHAEELARARSELNAVVAEAARTSADRESLGSALAAERAAREAVEAQFSGAAAEISRLRAEQDRTAKEIDDARREAAFSREEKERRVGRAESSMAGLRAELERAEAKLEAFRAEEAELRLSQTLLFTEVSEARSDAARIQAEMEQLASHGTGGGRR